MAKRGRWWKRFIVLALALAVLAGAAELALRLIIPGVVETAVRDKLNISSDERVDVTLGGSALLHALTGRIGDVTIDASNVTLVDGVTADVTLTAASIPFNPTSGEMRDAAATLTLHDDQVDPIVALLTRGVAESGQVQDGELVVSRSITVLGINVPITAGLSFGVDSGAVTVEPTSVGAAGLDLSAEQIAAATGSTLDAILQPHTVCIADQLPRGVTLTNIDLSQAGEIGITASLAPGLLSDGAERETGTCD
ncbi:MAG: LmeA family phospholipid-binding protein [Leucobacter sp.]